MIINKFINLFYIKNKSNFLCGFNCFLFILKINLNLFIYLSIKLFHSK